MFFFQLKIKGVPYPSSKELDFYAKNDVMITAPSSVKDEQFLGSTAMQNQLQQLGFKKKIVNMNFNQSFFSMRI